MPEIKQLPRDELGGVRFTHSAAHVNLMVHAHANITLFKLWTTRHVSTTIDFRHRGEIRRRRKVLGAQHRTSRRTRASLVFTRSECVLMERRRMWRKVRFIYTSASRRSRRSGDERAHVLDGRSKDAGCESDDEKEVGDVYKSPQSASSHFTKAPSCECLEACMSQKSRSQQRMSRGNWSRRYYRTYCIAFENDKIKFSCN